MCVRCAMCVCVERENVGYNAQRIEVADEEAEGRHKRTTHTNIQNTNVISGIVVVCSICVEYKDRTIGCCRYIAWYMALLNGLFVNRKTFISQVEFISRHTAHSTQHTLLDELVLQLTWYCSIEILCDDDDDENKWMGEMSTLRVKAFSISA